MKLDFIFTIRTPRPTRSPAVPKAPHFFAVAVLCAASASADEALFGLVKGAEPLPRHAAEVYVSNNVRAGKGVGTYRGINSDFEYERGFTDRLTASLALRTQSIKTEGIRVDAYIPQ